MRKSQFQYHERVRHYAVCGNEWPTACSILRREGLIVDGLWGNWEFVHPDNLEKAKSVLLAAGFEIDTDGRIPAAITDTERIDFLETTSQHYEDLFGEGRESAWSAAIYSAPMRCAKDENFKYATFRDAVDAAIIGGAE